MNFKLLSAILFAIGIVGGYHAQAKNYYFSNSGNDKANGQSPKYPWRTLDAITRIKLKPGDTLFFQRGSVFDGSVEIGQSGKPGKPIVFTAYGTGPNPILTGAISLANWTSSGENRFESKGDKKVYDLFVDGELYTPARYPNSGFLVIDKGVKKDSIFSKQLNQPDGYWTGATLRLRPIDWVYETRTVKEYTRGLIIQGRQSRYQIEKSFLQRTKNGETGIYDFQKGYGFYLEGLPQMVDSATEWSWVNKKLVVQLPGGESPKGKRIAAVVHPYGIMLKENTRYITIDGLSFEHFEKAGILGSWHLANVIIRNNTFKQIHGAGVLFDSASFRCSIVNNAFSDILGRGISALEPVSLEITNNTIKKIGTVRGQGWSGVNGASGIVIHNVERKIQFDTTYAHHNVVSYNRVDSCGYNGIRVDGSYNLVEFNVVEHCSLTLNDGANIYCFASGPGVTHHSVFRNNIVRYSVGDSKATPGNPNLAFGIYIDNRSYNMLVEKNIVISTGASGIVNNDGSYNNTFRRNTIFGCKDGLGFAEWASVGQIFGLVVEENLVVGLTPEQKAISIINWLAPTLDLGKLSRNTYVNATATQFFYYATKQIPNATRLELSFDQWKLITNNDKDSEAVTANTEWVKDKVPTIIVNDSREEKSLNFDTPRWMIDGTLISEPVKITPFNAIVLFKKPDSTAPVIK